MKQHSRRSQTVSVLVLLLSLSACQAAPSFGDWLASKQSGAASTQSEGYEYSGARENIHQCLKEVNNKNCRVIGDPENPAAAYFESGVTCCDARSHSGNSMGNSNIEVGNCKFMEQFFPEDMPIHEAPGVYKVGEFSVQCYLNAASDSCGHPFCDQMVLSASGGIYHAEDVVLTSRPITPTIEASCVYDDSDNSNSSKKQTHGVGPAAGKGHKSRRFAKAAAAAGKASVASAAEPAYKSKDSTLHTGMAEIYFGPMTINSRVHDVKLDQGWFEYTYDYIAGEEIREADAEGKHVVDPYTYNLKFYKPSEGSY